MSDIKSQAIYVEDELGVIVYGLSAAELLIVAKTCAAIAKLPEAEREALYEALNSDRFFDTDEDEEKYSHEEDEKLH
jgi:hypothetical protein